MSSNEDKYFVISNSDGECYVQVMTASQVEGMLNEDGGDYYKVDPLLKGNTSYWGEGNILIVKGEAVGVGEEVRRYLK